MTKKIFSLLLTLLMSIGAWAVVVDGISYNTNSTTKTAYVTSSNPKYSGDITIPATITVSGVKYQVTEIGSKAFEYCYELTSISLPEGLLKIGANALRQTGIKTLVIPSTLQEIGTYGCYAGGLQTVTIKSQQVLNNIYSSNSAFDLLFGGVKTFIIEEGITSIGNYVFKSCLGLTSVSLPSTLQTIGDYAFADLSQRFKSITLPDGLTSIGKYAFSDCDSLTSITIPDNVTEIGEGAFSKCPVLESVQLPKNLTKISSSLFENCKKLSKVNIPSNITSVGSSSFLNCQLLKSIKLPKGVTSIGASAFKSCAGLTSFTVPEGVKTIGSNAFTGCTNLASLSIPSTVETITSPMCSDCSSLTTVSLNSNYLTKKNYIYSSVNLAASFGEQVETFILGNSVTEIGGYAFRNSTASNIEIKGDVTSIGDYAFEGCKNLVSLEIPEEVESIGIDAFGSVFNLVYNGEATPPSGTTKTPRFTNAYIMNDVLAYNNVACTELWGCHRKATGAIEIAPTARKISEKAFSGCDNITSITIPSSVTSIGSSAFSGCDDITSLTIPSSVTSIGSSAFYGCRKLSSIEIPTSVTSIESSTFTYCVSLTSMVIHNKITSIGAQAFSYCSGLTSVTIPNSVTSIGEQAFRDCTKLTSITIPNSVTSIGGQAFQGCTGLSSVTIPNSVTSINQSTFYGCTGLSSIEIPNSVTGIGGYAFSGCTGLSSITIPSSVTSIENRAFYGCESLSSVRFEGEVAPERSDNVFFDSQQEKIALLVKSAAAKASCIEKGWNEEFKYILYSSPYNIEFVDIDATKGKAEIVKVATSWSDSLAQIRAIPNENYRFVKWSDDVTDNPRTIDMSTYGKEYTLQLGAEFIRQYHVNASKTGNGTASFQLFVNGTEQPAESDAMISETLDEKASIRIVLTPGSDCFFRTWSDGNTDLERTYTLTEDINLTAEVVKKHEVNIFSAGNGSTSGSGLYRDENVEISANANKTYRFDHWSDGNTENPRTIYVNGDITLTAYFIQAWDGVSSSEPAGDGTSSNPYKITNVWELRWYKEQVDANNNSYAVLAVDTLTIYGEKWEPIGSETHPFMGHFNGQNHYIIDYKVGNSAYSGTNCGLFGYAKDATLENIKVKGAKVQGQRNVGVICGQALSTNIIACDNESEVIGQNYVGGICGRLENSAKITNCNNEGQVTGFGDYVGGVAGYLGDAIVETCVNNKSVQSNGNYVGGIAGAINGSNSTVEGCSATETAIVVGAKYTGGLIGEVSNGARVSNNTSRGAVTGTNQEVGGLIGTLKGAYANKLSNYGSVTSSSSYVGGVIGNAIEGSQISACANAGMINASNDQYIGGLVGYAGSSTVIQCINIGVINGKNYTGGLIGYQYNDADMKQCANYGPVSGADRVGGLVGEARATLQDCMSAARVTGSTNNVGAVAGYVQSEEQVVNLTYDDQLCLLEVKIGNGRGEDNVYGVPTAELTGESVEGFNAVDWTMADKAYPTPVQLSSNNIRHAAASAIFFADGDNADNFGHDATISKISRSTWTSKGGTQINGTTAKPAILGADTLYAKNGKASKAVPVRVTNSTVTSYTLTVTAGNGGSVNDVNGKYAEGTEVEITATPDNKYHFLKWSDGNTDNPRTVTMSKDMTLEAQFEKDAVPTYTLSVTAGNGGTVDKQGGTFEEGTEVIVTATPNTGYRFTQWSDGYTQNPRTFILTENISITAQFEEIPPQQYTLTVTAGEGGTVNTAGGVYNEGTSVSLTATPSNEDYVFVKWSDGNTENPRTIIISGDTALKAEFAKVAYWQLTLSAGEGGTVSTDKEGSYRTGSQVTITATPSNEDYVFVKWSDGNTENPRTITMTADTTLKAEFAKVAYWQLTLSAGEGGTAKADKDGPYRTGSQVTITATPSNDDYYFVKWSDGNTENPRTLTMTADTTLKAEFAKVPYWQLTLSAGEGGTVKADKDGPFRDGSEVIITATADNDHKFVKWSDGNTENPRKIVMKSDTNLSAEFAEIAYSDIWIGTTVGGKAETDKSGKYEEGTTLTIQATADKGYVFLHWSNGSKDNPLVYTVTDKDEMIYPIFRSNDCAK